ncbi:uncharacterized protein EV154DRAFT_477939 [Mucor mucedo]|uniref:uncharacterized protein n=1 Tax=Mucor mucedo TaxID=29922 RepID=UPI00221FB90A|nr:uncharacterized protein EV154DRAFT_477939 [Mucor mucedo]KAI7894835.1 hypothetical protein EV154DRAFT_477939 [Mucor mucedo]
MIEHIVNVIDVGKDGNCGFRVIAIALGRNEDDCYDIRRELLMHLENNDEECMMFVKRVTLDIDGPCLEDNWMKMSQSGMIISDLYERLVHFFSAKGCRSFIPDCPQNKNKATSFVLLGGHYLSLNLKPDCPLPKIKKFKYLKTIADGHIEITTEYVDLIDSEKVDINHRKSAYRSDVKKITQKQEITQKTKDENV